MTDALGAARRIAAWADAGKLADDEWLVERNEYAIVDICRAYIALSARCERVEGALKEVLPFVLDATLDALQLYNGPRLDRRALCDFACAALAETEK